MSGSARKALEAMMRSSGYQYQSAIARQFVAQGREQGQQEGRLEGERSALLKVLDARGLEVDDAAREKLLACTDLKQLERWISEAAVATSVQDLFKRKRASKSRARTVAKHGRSVKPARPRTGQ